MENQLTENNQLQVQRTSIVSLITSQPITELSEYYGLQPATIDQIKNECKKLQACFPQMQPAMMGVMIDRIMSKKMPYAQVKDAVNNIIDNFKYPVPTVADVISWDKKVKLYTHAEVVADIPKGFEFSDYTMVTVNEEKRWIRK